MYTWSILSQRKQHNVHALIILKLFAAFESLLKLINVQ